MKEGKKRRKGCYVGRKESKARGNRKKKNHGKEERK